MSIYCKPVINAVAANTTELSETCKEVMQPEFESVGISLEKFFIENVSMPEELKKEIFEYSRLDKLDLSKLAQFKAAALVSCTCQVQHQQRNKPDQGNYW